MDILVGYTGFVGSNIYANHTFDAVYNSKNINDAFGTAPDLCVYSGVPAEKFLANQNPEQDLEIITNAMENIKQINPKRLVLISTVDIYHTPVDVDEDTVNDPANLQPYGAHRLLLENWVKENIEKHHIIRLPGLFGKNLKKNFIFDLINRIPSLLNEAKYQELNQKNKLIAEYYFKQENGFYKACYTDSHRKQLLALFDSLQFSALNFTDSRGVFQFYNLAYLWEHIAIILKNNLPVVNMAVEPVSVSEIYQTIKWEAFHNPVAKSVPLYDFKTKYSSLFGGHNGYIFPKETVLQEITQFVTEKL